jgi:hypothetical protein
LLVGLRAFWAERSVVFIFFLILIFSIALLFLVQFGLIPWPWDKIADVVAKAVLAGGSGAMLLKVLQIGNVFRKELESIIYDEKFTSLRSDRVSVWANFTRALYAERFPELSKSLSVEDMKAVLPTDRQFYLRETSRQIKIAPDPLGPTWIRITQKSSSILVTESGLGEVSREKEFKFESAAMTSDPVERKKMIEDRCGKFWKVPKGSVKGITPGGPPDASDQVRKIEETGNRTCVSYIAILQGDTCYQVLDSAESTQNLALDNTIAVMAMSYLVGLEVAVEFDPRVFLVQFHEIGGARFFDVDPAHLQLHKKTNRILFSDAGFLLTVQRRVSTPQEG